MYFDFKFLNLNILHREVQFGEILFFGTFIPLHGIDTIVKAANILKDQKDILFTICGDGQTKPEVEKLVANNNLGKVKLLGLVSNDKLLDLLNCNFINSLFIMLFSEIILSYTKATLSM